MDRKLFLVILIALVLGLAIPFHQTWGAPAFQTVPTVGPTPTRRSTTAPPTSTSAPPSQTAASNNTSVPTRTRRPTSQPPTSTDQAVMALASDTPEPTQAFGDTALPASDTPVPVAPSASPTLSSQALQAESTPTETQPSQSPAQSVSVTLSAEPPAQTKEGTNWLPAFVVVLVLLAVGIWLVQRRGAQRSA